MNDPASDIAQKDRSTRPSKLVVASNRLPTNLQYHAGELVSEPSSGGLASALKGFRSETDFAWVGWPGGVIDEADRPRAKQILARQKLAPVYLTANEEQLYYHGICNQVLWQLFHYFSDKLAFDSESWDTYVAVNRRFAQAILDHCDDNTRVWVHDFHLMLVPSMLRERRPDLQIGFFLHIPFPSSEIYRLLPRRREMLQGLLGANYIGFHTDDYARHFRSACLRVLALESEPNSIDYAGRRVGIGCNPIGIDVAGFTQCLESRETGDLVRGLAERYADRKLILGIERLDYTKGIPLKLQAYERFLERNPERAKDTSLLQVLVPSRLSHPDYQNLKNEIEKTVGRINGKYGGPGVTPVEYMHRSLPEEQLVSLYRYADVAMVTPIRDGMNLIAQEYVLCQRDADCAFPLKGVLILSEFAGAAHYLSRALMVNPWNIEAVAATLERALQLSADEKRERMQVMVDQVVDLDCHTWAQRFLEDMSHYDAGVAGDCRGGAASMLADQFAAASQRILALDYDGTLRELTDHPNAAEPTAEIEALLTELASLPNTELHLVSGRPAELMTKWFGHLPIHLAADHGFAHRPAGEQSWQKQDGIDLSWMDGVEATLAQVASEVPGTVVERKGCSVTWHYRMAESNYGAWRAGELLSMLQESLAGEPVDVIPGHRVIEVRAGGVNKGNYLRRILEATSDDALVCCAGDDRTDLDMYRVLPANGISIHVGMPMGPTTLRVESPAKLRALLWQLLSRPVYAARPRDPKASTLAQPNQNALDIERAGRL